MIMERCGQTEIFLIVNQRTVPPAVFARETVYGWVVFMLLFQAKNTTHDIKSTFPFE